MSLPHALLTSLLDLPCSGSELAGRFDRSIGYFWQASHQQIYRELSRLEAGGLIEALEPEASRGEQNEMVWSVISRPLQCVVQNPPPPRVQKKIHCES